MRAGRGLLADIRALLVGKNHQQYADEARQVHASRGVYQQKHERRNGQASSGKDPGSYIRRGGGGLGGNTKQALQITCLLQRAPNSSEQFSQTPEPEAGPHLVLLDNLPYARGVRVGGDALVYHAGRAVQQRAIGEVRVPGDPAAVCCAPVDVPRLQVKHIFGRHARHYHVPSCSAAGVEVFSCSVAEAFSIDFVGALIIIPE